MSTVGIQSEFRKLLVIATGLICASSLAIGATIWWLRNEAIFDGYRDSKNLATGLARQISNSIQSIDLVLTEIRDQEEIRSARSPDEFERILGAEDTHQFLMECLSHLPQAQFVTLVDRNGRLANATLQWPLPDIDLSDRADFKHFKDSGDQGLFIGDTLLNRINGVHFVSFSKRISGANGAFLGEVVIGVGLDYFRHIYESVVALRDEMFVLFDRDGTLIVRYPDKVVRSGQKLPAESPWYRIVQAGGGTYRAPGIFDGQPRLMAVQPLRDYPLVVNVGLTETAALGAWHVQAITLAVGTLLVVFCSMFLLRALNKQFSRVAASEVALQEKARELESANARLETAQVHTTAALENMSQGLVMYDAAARLVVCNQRYLGMYGLSAEVVRPGLSLREVLDVRAATGSCRAAEVGRFHTEILAAVTQGAVFERITLLPDGRIIRIVNHPMKGGGWVSTHEDITAERRAEERVAYAASVDTLTGLPNRRAFCDQLEEELKRVKRGEQLAILYLDVDFLKQVNDTLGYPAGDKLLNEVADRVRGCLRDTDVVARIGGDDFAVIQKLLKQPADAAALAKRIHDVIRDPFDIDGHEVKVNISIGITVAPNDAIEIDGLLKAADMALYEAKKRGRGTFCFYEPGMNVRMQARAQLERDLHRALASGEFKLLYQPIADLDEGKIVSFEALLRWHHPERGLISPTEFIPVAEDMGLIIPLGEWVLRTACAEAANWPDDVTVSVNVSSIQLTNKKLTNTVVGAIASAGIKPNRLELELTESALVENTLANLDVLESLRDLGVRFVMDDFGTGYSSLSYLLRFPFHKIKIDRCFISALSDSSESHAIVRAIADLARSLKLRVTAEGVETAQQLQQIRLLGCTEMQGHYFSAPRPASEISRFFTPHGESAGNLISVNASDGRRNEKMCTIRPDLVCNHLLTGRECDVLIGIMAGKTSKESARHLNISPRTVELHRGRIMKKFDVRNSADLVRVMLTMGCPPLPSNSADRSSPSHEIGAAVTLPSDPTDAPSPHSSNYRRNRALI